MNRDQLLATAGETLAYAEDFFETKVELVKLDVAEKGARIGADVISGIIVAVLGLAGSLFLFLGLAIWLGHLVGSYALGFVIVGVFFILLAAILFALRESLLARPILKSLISSLFKSKPNERPQQH